MKLRLSQNIAWGAVMVFVTGCSPSHVGQDDVTALESVDPADMARVAAWADSVIAYGGSEPYEQADASMLELWGLAVDKDAVSRELMRRIVQRQRSVSRSWPVVDDCADLISAAAAAWSATGNETLQQLALSYGMDAISRAEAVNFDSGSGLFRGLGCEFTVYRDEYPSWTRVAQAYMSRRLDRNVMYVRAYRGLSQLCALERRTLKNHCDSMAQCVTMAVNNHMWMPKRGYHGSMLYGNIFMARASSLDYAGECAAILYGVVNDEVGAWIMEHMPVTEQQLPRQYPMTGRTIDVGWGSARRHLLYCMAASQTRNRAALVHGLTCAISMCAEPGAGYAEAAMIQGIICCTRYKEILADNIHSSAVNYQPDRMMAAWPRTRWTSDGKQMVAGYRHGEQFVVMLDGEPEGVMESAEYSIGTRDSFTTVALVPVDDEGWEGFSSVIRRYIPVGCERIIEAEMVATPGTHLIRERVMAGRYAELGANVNADITFRIDVDTPGVYAMELVYADGKSNRYNQLRSLYVNGVRCGEFVMPRIGAGPSTKAVSTPVMAVLGKGKNSVNIRVSDFLEPGAGCILLDKIRLIKIN